MGKHKTIIPEKEKGRINCFSVRVYNGQIASIHAVSIPREKRSAHNGHEPKTQGIIFAEVVQKSISGIHMERFVT